MKRMIRQITAAAVLGMLMPALMLSGARWLTEEEAVFPGTEPEPPEQSGTVPEQTEQPVLISVLTDGSVEQMELEAYLVGVILRELPDEFDIEAMKAQAVVARTLALRIREHGGKHDGGIICTRASCCQGYRTLEDYYSDGGTRDGVDKAVRAVQETAGLVLTYGGELIEATYFSSSGGRTEAAVAVWGSDVPYLQSTQSPEEQHSQTVVFTAEEFRAALGAELTGLPGYWFGEVTYTEGGGVDTMVIGGVAYKGTELRRLLGLRSTAFVLTAVGDHITVTTRGYGHRVGMSQYGAEAMAVSGSSFREILAHYYQGTVLEYRIDKTGEIG